MTRNMLELVFHIFNKRKLLWDSFELVLADKIAFASLSVRAFVCADSCSTITMVTEEISERKEMAD